MDNAVINELRAADARLEASINEVRRQAEQHAARIGKAEANIVLLNELATELRESIATKDDIAALRSDLREREALHERLDHYRDRMQEMEDENKEKRDDEKHDEAMRLNRRMAWMFVGEIVLGIGMLFLGWLGIRHG